MKEWITRTIVGTVFLMIAGLLLSPHFSNSEIVGLYFLMVAAKV